MIKGYFKKVDIEKELGIEPKMSASFQEYWDFFKSKGCL